ncbi:kinesin-like protein KIFC3 [Aplysia californica]|uniref:Kinesin-like protein n=1 Tax=Aplysia californica TaxID=6500 RepID=A0ABM1VTZ3_APLCA|nr:kinesin-like protein KIFC3 [Aplysia californica]XP_035825885.1 kinesin-like protein KIFC3 [Aplysia californica]
MDKSGESEEVTQTNEDLVAVPEADDDSTRGSFDSGVATEDMKVDLESDGVVEAMTLSGTDGQEDSHPRKRKREEAFKAADKSKWSYKLNGQDIGLAFDEAAFQVARENLKGYRYQLQARLAKPRPPLHMQQQLKKKEDLINTLRERINELEKILESNKDLCPSGDEENEGSCEKKTPTRELLHFIKQLEEENEELTSQVREQESNNKSLRKDLRRLEAELYRCKCQLIENGIYTEAGAGNPKDKRIKELEEENERLQLALYKTEDKAAARELELWKQTEDLKLKLIDAEIQNMNDWAKYREWMSLKHEASKKIVVEQRSKPTIDPTALQSLQDSLSVVQTSQQTLKKLAELLPLSVETHVKETGRQVHRALLAVECNNKELQAKYSREMKLRKRFHNQLVELRGNIRVFCRVRPWIKEDGDCKITGSSVLTFDPMDDGVLTVANKSRSQDFELDKVFNCDVSQRQMFDEVSDLISSVLDGYNVCIFAYGQTGSGKTHTMEGPPEDPGVNQRALKFLYEEARASAWHYDIEASVMEIYNEQIRDLLNPDPINNKLEVKLRPEGGLHVPGLVRVPVHSLDEVNEISEQGRRNRATAATNMNEHSSRSHCLLCVTVTGLNSVTGDRTFGRLNLVDLAGSERVSKSQADGARLKEAQNINKSLSSLGDVINALKNKHSHVPYRNSKLTYLLQESLGGDSKTLMILQVSPAEKNLSESICTLTFGQRVRSAELGAATKRLEEGNKGTPSSARRPPQDTLGTPSSQQTGNRTPNLPRSATGPGKLKFK